MEAASQLAQGAAAAAQSAVGFHGICLAELERHKKLKDAGFRKGPLGWREKSMAALPSAAALARKLLAAQATSAPAERIFSRASRIISALPTRLDPAMASKLLYVGENLAWYEEQLALLDAAKKAAATADADADAREREHQAAAAAEKEQQQEEKEVDSE